MVKWYRKFEGWFGDIEGVLNAHPVLNKEQAVSRETDLSHEAEKEVAAGANDEPTKGHQWDHQNGRNSDGSAKNGISNGNSKRGAKKRKADLMPEE